MKKFYGEVADWSILFFTILFLLTGTYQRNIVWNNGLNCENGHNSMGLAYKGIKKLDKAIQSFHDELKFNPDNVYIHLYLGESYEVIKNYPMALAHYKKALSYPNLSDAGKIRKAVLALEVSQKQKKEERIDGKD